MSIMARESKSETQTCAECKQAVPAERSVHCTSRGLGALKYAHHGHWRWNCPQCGRRLGCDACAGRFAADVFCGRCRIYADGERALVMTVEERRLLIALVPHASPSRATSIERLAEAVGCDPSVVLSLISSVKQKGVAIAASGNGYYVHQVEMTTPPAGAPARQTPLRGIELSLPLSDRDDRDSDRRSI